MKPVSSVSNQSVADVLDEISQLLELKGESAFRIRAYENAARTIRHMSGDVGQMAATARLREISGVGEALALKIEELANTGQMAYLEKLRAEFPPGVRRLMAVPGVGPKLAARAYQELGIDSLESLREAATDGRLAALPRLGQKSADNLLKAIERAQGQETRRCPIGDVLPYVAMVMQRLQGHDFIRNLTVAGSLRRFRETIKDVDIIGTFPEPEKAFEVFLSIPGVLEVIARGPTKLSIINDRGLQVDFRIVPDVAYGSLLQHFTGSAAHNVQLREYALKRGQSLSEYGIVDVESAERTPFADETEFYAALGLPWIPPELREGLGELEAAIKGQLPDLITCDDLRGDLHAHTKWSDGKATVEAMVAAAVERGYEYIAITDHSPMRPGGLSPSRLWEQALEIDEARKLHPEIRVLHGTEVDIRNDGSLDLPDETLAELDWVVASAHSSFGMDEDQMTRRLVAAARSPHVDMIGHATGRKLGRRPPYALDVEALFRAAAESGTIVEVNSSLSRLDLKDTHVRQAIELGVTIAVNTDAHNVEELGQIEFGVRVARRGWAESKDVANAWPVEEVLAKKR